MSPSERIRSLEDVLESMIPIMFSRCDVSTMTFNLWKEHLRRRDEQDRLTQKELMQGKPK